MLRAVGHGSGNAGDSKLRAWRILFFFGLLVPPVLGLLVLPGSAADQNAQPNPSDWPAVERVARGQTVYWNAWAGEASINSYIGWAAQEVEKRFGVRVEQVKLSDTAEAVSKVVAEKAAGRDSGGTVDLIWINGPNFASMKDKKLLYGPWARASFRITGSSIAENPAVITRFYQSRRKATKCPGTRRGWSSITTACRVEKSAAQYCGYSRLSQEPSRALHLSRCAEFPRCDISQAGADRTDGRPISIAEGARPMTEFESA